MVAPVREERRDSRPDSLFRVRSRQDLLLRASPELARSEPDSGFVPVGLRSSRRCGARLGGSPDGLGRSGAFRAWLRILDADGDELLDVFSLRAIGTPSEVGAPSR